MHLKRNLKRKLVPLTKWKLKQNISKFSAQRGFRAQMPILKKERSQSNNLSFHFKEVEKKEEKKPKVTEKNIKY